MWGTFTCSIVITECILVFKSMNVFLSESFFISVQLFRVGRIHTYCKAFARMLFCVFFFQSTISGARVGRIHMPHGIIDTLHLNIYIYIYMYICECIFFADVFFSEVENFLCSCRAHSHATYMTCAHEHMK